MTTDLYSTVLFQDGEQFTFTDANNMQRFVQAQLTDQVLETMQPYLSQGSFAFDADFWGINASPPRNIAYCLTPGAAYLRKGTANSKISLGAGVLLQKVGNQTGGLSTLVPFSFGTNAALPADLWTLTNGDATNPRVDVLQMKLEYINDTPGSVDFQDAVTRAPTTNASASTRCRVQCTTSVRVGTPASSPTIPEPDTGFCAVGYVIVGNGWTTAGAAPIFGVDTAATNNIVVHDTRMPLGVRAYVADPSTFKLATAFALTDSGCSATASNATNTLYVPCPVTSGRLVGVGVYFGVHTVITGSHVVLGSFGANTIASFAPQASCSDVSGTPLIGLADTMENFGRIHFEGHPTPAVGPTIAVNFALADLMSVPLWANGLHAARPKFALGGGAAAVKLEQLAAKIVNVTNGTTISAVTFYVAG